MIIEDSSLQDPGRLRWTYAVVPAALDVARAPAGVDGGRVELVREGDVGALVSPVNGATYAVDAEQLVGEVGWLAPRATAHDAVTTWASDRGAVVPLPMFTLYNDEAGVRAMLRERATSLAGLLARVSRGREYVVRLYRLDDELAPALVDFSPRIATLERQAAEATPGQRYLLQRKLETERREESRRVGHDLARTAWESLAALSLDAVADELPRAAEGARGAAILNAAFLVAHEGYAEFQAAVTELVRRHEGRGLRVEFTGPWPPHHFTRQRERASEGTADRAGEASA